MLTQRMLESWQMVELSIVFSRFGMSTVLKNMAVFESALVRSVEFALFVVVASIVLLVLIEVVTRYEGVVQTWYESAIAVDTSVC